MASWYRKFLADLATIADPLNHLAKHGVTFVWNEEAQSAFEQIKASAPILHGPSFDHPFVIQTDKSDSGLGAVLTQIIDGVERVLCFSSRTMTPAEWNYSVTELECLAVLWAIRKFRPYVEGYHFTVITDHSSLKWLCNLYNPTGRQGSLNYVPDALSRMYEDETDVELASLETAEETTDAWYKRIRICSGQPRDIWAARLSLYYYWSSMRKETVDFVRNCLICHQCNVNKRHRPAL